MSKDLNKVVQQVGKLLAKTEAGIAAAAALDDALIARADEIDAIRQKDMQRCAQLLQSETVPARLREVERQYVAAAVDRNRAQRVARYLRDRRAARKQAEVEYGRPLLSPSRSARRW